MTSRRLLLYCLSMPTLTPETIILNEPMERILKGTLSMPEAGALVKGTVIGKNRLAIYVDVPPFGTGLIFGREYLNARDLIKEVKVGDYITAKVVLPEGEDGYIELSLKEAKQALLWSDAKKAIDGKESYDLLVKEANKGGLILEWQGIEGFLPASQLKAEHYPKVPDGDKIKIMDELKRLVGEKLSVYVIGADPKDNKLIFSEKNGEGKSRKEIIAQYALGDTVMGEVTGIVDFGVFVKLEEGFEGLVHISEIDWALVENPRDRFKVGEKIQAKVIEIKEGKVSLSVKALKTNPWIEAENKYKKGDEVKGVIIKHNKHGALVSLEEGVAGLSHISEFKGEDELRRALELGKTYRFKINLFDAKNQKLTMSLVPLEVRA